ncbi:MAG: hypothetical protein ACAH88_14255 [Roseimicrobium sp.]
MKTKTPIEKPENKDTGTKPVHSLAPLLITLSQAWRYAPSIP